MTTRREIYIEHIRSLRGLGYKRGSDITEGDIPREGTRENLINYVRKNVGYF